MAAINFPPRTQGVPDLTLVTLGDLSTEYYWTGEQWLSVGLGGGGASVTIQSTPPSSPSAGDLWYDNDSGILSIYYNDGNSSQWVDVGGGDSAPSTEIANLQSQIDALNNTMQNIGNYPYLEVGWVTAPNADRYTVTLDSNWQALNLTSVISQNGVSFGSLDSLTNRVTINSGTYRYQVELVGWIDSVQTNYTAVMALYATDDTYICSTGRNGDASFSTWFPWTGQFTIDSSKTIELRLAVEGAGSGAEFYIGNYDTGTLVHNNSTANSSTRISLKLWKVG